MLNEAYSIQRARAIEILERIQVEARTRDRQKSGQIKYASPLVRAIENLGFANGLITPDLQDVLRYSGRQVTFHPLAHRLFAGHEIVFGHTGQGRLVWQFSIEGNNQPSRVLTTELIRETLWEANCDRRLVRYFGGLSQAKIVDKFLQTIKR